MPADSSPFEAQLRQSQKLEAIGQLASGIAHEINTPTQYIGDNLQFFRESFAGFVQLFEKYSALLAAVKRGDVPELLLDEIASAAEEIDLEFLLEETPGAIERALEGNRRVAEVVRAMKEFAHPGAEGMIPTDINRALKNTISVSRNEWKYVADVKTELDPRLPLTPCMAGPLNQALLNVLVNASHAIGDVVEEGATEKGLITVTTTHDETSVEIRIADTGTGMPAEVAEKIYNPFFTTKPVGQGTGQGMAIARSVVVETHHGSLDFETVEGEGTTFIIRLPLEQDTEINDQ